MAVMALVLVGHVMGPLRAAAAALLTPLLQMVEQVVSEFGIYTRR
jgi:predicted membrane protein